MKWIYISLCSLLFVSCVRNENKNQVLFTDKLVNQWEKATMDSINNIYDRNKNTKEDTFELELLRNNYHKGLYHHSTRMLFLEDLNNDSVFIKNKIKEFILIEKQHAIDPNFDFYLIYNSNNQYKCLAYRLTREPKRVYFKMIKQETINEIKLKSFEEEVRRSNLFINRNIKYGEYEYGYVVVSFFSKDKVEVFPFLTSNFSNEVYRRYEDMYEDIWK